MADIVLEKSTPFESCDLPVVHGAARLEAVEMGAIFSVSPLKGQRAAVEKLLGNALPDAGQTAECKHAELVWFGMGQWFAFADAGGKWLEDLSGVAAVTDQSDGWLVMELSGADAVAVMARLCPLDLSALMVGQVARSDFAHVSAMIIPRKKGFWVAMPRSFAGSVVESTVEAMKSLAAQALL